MASIQFIRLLSSSISSSIESWRGRRDGDHSYENISGVIFLVRILLPHIYRTKIIKMVRQRLEGIADEFPTSELGKELAESQRYFRFSVPQGLQELEMDEWKETEKMRALTTEYLRKVGTGQEVKRCAESLLRPDEIC